MSGVRHCMPQKKNPEFFFLKLNFEKAYDKVNSEFLFNCLKIEASVTSGWNGCIKWLRRGQC